MAIDNDSTLTMLSLLPTSTRLAMYRDHTANHEDTDTENVLSQREPALDIVVSD